MMKKFIPIILIINILFISCNEQQVHLPKVNQNKTEVIKFRKDGELSFQSQEGNILAVVNIEIADTEEKRATGLMFRENIKENEAMLFVFAREEYQSFWMKNTPTSLDMIFVNSKREIVNIQKNTEPYSTTSYPSTAPAIYVIEVIAGFTDKFNIKPGDKVNWRLVR